MFAALTVARLREAVFTNSDTSLRTTRSWVSPDSVQATQLPLANAAIKVLESMHSILGKTLEARDVELAASSPDQGSHAMSEEEKQKCELLRESKAAEVRLVRNTRFLHAPTVRFQAQEWRE